MLIEADVVYVIAYRQTSMLVVTFTSFVMLTLYGHLSAASYTDTHMPLMTWRDGEGTQQIRHCR